MSPSTTVNVECVTDSSRFSHLLNTPFPMNSSWKGKVTSSNNEHSEKAFSPIYLTVETSKRGTETKTSDLQPLKT